MFQIRRSRKRFNGCVRKLFGENAAKSRAKLLARDAAAARGESVRRNSSLPGLERPNRCTSRTMRSAVCSFTRTTRRVRLRSSDHKCTSGSFRLAPQLALQSREFGQPLAIFANFHVTRAAISVSAARVRPNHPRPHRPAFRYSPIDRHYVPENAAKKSPWSSADGDSGSIAEPGR